MSRLFLLLCAALAAANPAQDASVRSKPVSLIFDTKQIIVNPTESLSLDCGVSGEYRYCHWEKGLTQVLQVQDVYDGYMDGLRKPDNIKGNECGIVINSVTTEDHGQWTCKVFVVGNTLTGTKNVTVTIRPTSPVLEVNNRPLMIDEDTEKTVSCSVAAARPQASIHWFLGEEDISYNSKTENSLTDNMGTYKSLSTLKHEFKAWNNNKPLRCSVTHYTLDLPIEDYVDIRVNYMPWGKDESLYGIRLGDDVEATLDFSSNPSPRQVRWGYGTNFEEIQAVLPVPGKEGRYSTEVIALDEGHYTVILSVLEFAEMDSKMDFKIAVRNDLGEREFKINLSNEKPPNAVIADPISTGILASILVVVFCIITLLCCTCYMKLTHKYCFADSVDSKVYMQDGEVGLNGNDFHQPHHMMPEGYQYVTDHQYQQSGNHNSALKMSNDTLNGNMLTQAPLHHDSIHNVTFNGNSKSTAIDHNDYSLEEKINTDV